MRINLIFTLLILHLSGHAITNSPNYTFGDLQNVIASVEISSLQYEESTDNVNQPSLKIYLCAVDNPPQVHNPESTNIRKGKSYLVFTANEDDNSVIPLPGEGDTIYIDGMGTCDVDWSYISNGIRYMYILLNTGLYESKINLSYLTGFSDPIEKIHYTIQGRTYNFVYLPTESEKDKMDDYLEYINKVASFYLSKTK